MAVVRSAVEDENKWDVESFYPSWEAWEREFEHLAVEKKERWPDVTQFRGRLGEGAGVLKEAIEKAIGIERVLDRLATYAHLRQDENLADDDQKSRYQRAVSLYHDYHQHTAWMEPELLSLEQSILDAYLGDKRLADYRFHLDRIVRKKPHTLTEKEEELMALSGQALSASHRAFGMLENADFRFAPAKDAEGAEHEITLGSYSTLQRQSDRTLRRTSFESLHGQFSSYENTICELLNGQVQAHLFDAKAHGFDSCLEAALFPHAVDPSVYHNLIKTVRANLMPLHRYMSLRKHLMNLEQVHLYDVYVPLSSLGEKKIAYQEAVDLCVESVKPLGSAYQEKLRAGLGEERWVDRYENEGKRSGAYSSGCFDSHPYILMNYDGTLRDVMTLAHEAGHSMHSFHSHQAQPYHYSHYPIFVAEVASTFNEELLLRLLLDKAQSEEERFALINQKVDDIRGTLYRQTMFAEFELMIHQMAEEGIPLTPSVLREKYLELNVDYFGADVVVDQEISIEWARIPHFYYNFYVYQYATGISAALALAEKVLNGKSSDRDAYLKFLSSGSVDYPIELLKVAGVDMTKPEPVELALGRFDQLVGELERLSPFAQSAKLSV